MQQINPYGFKRNILDPEFWKSNNGDQQNKTKLNPSFCSFILFLKNPHNRDQHRLKKLNSNKPRHRELRLISATQHPMIDHFSYPHCRCDAGNSTSLGH